MWDVQSLRSKLHEIKLTGLLNTIKKILCRVSKCFLMQGSNNVLVS